MQVGHDPKVPFGAQATYASTGESRSPDRCEKCNLVIDRDLNAARNLAAYGRRVLSVAVSGAETQNGRGRDTTRTSGTGSGSRLKRQDGSGQPGKADTASPAGEAA